MAVQNRSTVKVAVVSKSFNNRNFLVEDDNICFCCFDSIKEANFDCDIYLIHYDNNIIASLEQQTKNKPIILLIDKENIDNLNESIMEMADDIIYLPFHKKNLKNKIMSCYYGTDKINSCQNQLLQNEDEINKWLNYSIGAAILISYDGCKISLIKANDIFYDELKCTRKDFEKWKDNLIDWMYPRSIVTLTNFLGICRDEKKYFRVSLNARPITKAQDDIWIKAKSLYLYHKGNEDIFLMEIFNVSDFVKSETDMKEQTNRISNIFSHINTGIIIIELNEKMECKFHNEFIRYLLGYNEKEFNTIMKQNPLTMILNSDTEEFRSFIYKCINFNEKQIFSTALIKKDGAIINAKIYLELIQENSKKFLFINIIDIDKEKNEVIDKEKEIEKLSGIKENLNTLYQISANPIMKLVAKNDGYKIASCNEAFIMLTETSRKTDNEVLLDSFINKLSKKSFQLLNNNIKETFLYKKHSECEITFRNNEGRTIYLHTVLNRVKDTDNSYYLQCIFRDISEQKENQELSYYRFLRSAYVAIYEINIETNESKLKNYDENSNIAWNINVSTHDERIKYWLENIVYEEDRKTFLEFTQQYMYSEKMVYSLNFRIFDKDRNIQIFRFISMKMDSNIYLLCIENRTEEKTAEYKMRDMLINSAVDIQRKIFAEASISIAENNTIAVFSYEISDDKMVMYTNMPQNICEKKEYDNFTFKIKDSLILDENAKENLFKILTEKINYTNGSFYFYASTEYRGKALCNLVYRYVFDTSGNAAGITGFIKPIQYDYDIKALSERIKSVTDDKYEMFYPLFGSIYRKIFTEKNLSEKLDSIMEVIGRYFDLSRVAVYIEEENQLSIKNIYEWTNDGFEKKFTTVKTVLYPIECNGHYEKYFDSDNLWILNSTNNASEEIIDLFLQLDIMATLQAIIYKNGRYIGFIAFYDCKGTHIWRQAEKNSIGIIADILGLYMERYDNKISFDNNQPRFAFDFIMDKSFRLQSPEKNFYCYNALKCNNYVCENCPIQLDKETYNDIDFLKIGYDGTKCCVEYAMQEDFREASKLAEKLINSVDEIFLLFIDTDKNIIFTSDNSLNKNVYIYIKIEDFLSEMEKLISRLKYKIILEFYNNYILKNNEGSIVLTNTHNHIEFTLNAFHLKNNNTMVSVLVKEITENNKIELNNNYSQNLQEMTINSLGLDYAVFDLNHNLKFISDIHIKNVTNFKEFTITIYNDFIHPDDRYKWTYFINILSQENETILRMRLHYGIYRWKKIIYRKYTDDEYAILFKDVNEEMNSRLQLMKNKVEIQSIGKAINCGFALYKIDKNIELLYISPVLYKYFGYTDNDYSNNIIKNDVKEFAPINSLFNKESLFKLMEEGRIDYYKKEFVRCDGRKFYADVNIVISENGTENPIIYITINDNTEYYHNEQQFNNLISLKNTYFIRIKEETPDNIIPISLCDIYDSGYNAELNLLLASTDFYSLMNKENQNKFKKLIDFNCEENAIVNSDIEILGPNNKPIYLRCNGQLIINEYNKKEYYIAMTDITDITIQLIENNCTEKEEDDFLNGSPFGAIIMNFDGESIETIKLNDNLLRIIGINKAIGQGYEEILRMHPYDKKLFISNIKENYNEIINNKFSVRLLGRDNNYISTTFIVKIHNAIDSKHLFINVIENTYIESLKNLLNNEQMKLKFIAEYSDCSIWQYDITEKALNCINYKENPYFNEKYENIPYGLLENTNIDETTKQELLDLYFAMERGCNILHKNIVFHNGDKEAEYEFTFTAIYKKDEIIDVIGIGKLL